MNSDGPNQQIKLITPQEIKLITPDVALLSNAEQFSKMYMKTHEGMMNENLHF